MKKSAAGAVFVGLTALSACGPGNWCPTLHGETVSARAVACADLQADAKRFDGETIDVRGRLEQTMLGARLRLLDPNAEGDCGRIAGTGVMLRLDVDEKVQRDCTKGLNRKFARVVGKLKVAPPTEADPSIGNITPITIVPLEN